GPATYTYNCGNTGTDPGILLSANTKTPITIEFQNQTGDGHVLLKWDAGTGTWGYMSGSNLLPNLNLLTSEVSPLQATTTYPYSDQTNDYRMRARPITETVSDGVTSRTTAYTYDSYGRLSTKTNTSVTPNIAMVTNTYTDVTGANGQTCLTRLVDGAG